MHRCEKQLPLLLNALGSAPMSWEALRWKNVQGSNVLRSSSLKSALLQGNSCHMMTMFAEM